MNFRSSLACTSSDIARWGLRSVLKRQGGVLPGRIAMKIDPELLSDLAGLVDRSVVITGTNGKTTTSNLIADAVAASGATVVCNRAGNNMEPGVVGALLEARGNLKQTAGSKRVGVFECDELYTVRVLPKLKPTYFVLLNLFRDQLDRYGEIDHTQDVIAEALRLSPETTLIYNADDPLCAAIAARVGNASIGFGIDEKQAEYVAEIKLRNINKEYILKRVQETEDLQKEIADLEDTLQKPARIRKIIVGELEQVRKKYAVPRRTEILYGHEVEEYVEDDQPEDYPVTVFLSREGYFKKITPKSLRMSGEQKYKEGDGLRQQAETGNNAEIMFFTDRCQVYKTRVSEFGDSKASVLGDYLPGRLAMDEGERVIFMVLPGDYSGCLLFFYENGKAARVELSAYATVSNRRKLTGAYSDKSPLVSILPLPEDRELALVSTEPRALLVHTSLLAPKTTRNVQGVAVMTLKPKYHLDRVLPAEESGIVNLARYRTRTIPAAGAILKPEDRGEEQLTLL